MSSYRSGVLYGARAPEVRALFSSHPTADSHSSSDRSQMRPDSHHSDDHRFPSQSESDSRESVDRTWTTLPPVWSGGQADSPDFAFVFINPTYRNQSVIDDWPDEYRAPHIGHKRIWQFLESCQLLPGTHSARLPDNFTWDMDAAEGIYHEAATHSLYVTNLVKACRTTSALPSLTYARQWTDLLNRELEIVKPQIIIAFGTLTVSVLAGWPFRMRDAYESAHPVAISSPALGRLIFPVYFPCGRGEPAKSREMVMRIADARIKPGGIAPPAWWLCQQSEGKGTWHRSSRPPRSSWK